MWRIDTVLDLRPEVRDEVHRLVAEVEAHDGYRPLSDHLWLELVHGARSGYAAVLARSVDGNDGGDGDRGGTLAGYAQLSHSNDSWTLETVVRPSHRRDLAELGGALVTTALDLVAHRGGGPVHWWVFRPDECADRIAAANGLRPERRLLQMRRPLPLDDSGPPAPHIVTRPFEVGRDEEAWLEVNNAAFAWHPEQGGWNLDTLRQREGEHWFDPAGFLLHERDGRLAGFCWTKVHADEDPPIGEIYVVAVHPDFHSLGLGNALTRAGLHSLAERGLTEGMLFVDADNTTAVTLYERLGFTVHHVDCAYVADVEPLIATGDPT